MIAQGLIVRLTSPVNVDEVSIGGAGVVTGVLADAESPEVLGTTADLDHRTGLMTRTPFPRRWSVTNLAVIGSRKSSALTIAGQKNVPIPAVAGRRSTLAPTVGSRKGLPAPVASRGNPPNRTAGPLAPMEQSSLSNPALRSTNPSQRFNQPRHPTHQLRSN